MKFSHTVGMFIWIWVCMCSSLQAEEQHTLTGTQVHDFRSSLLGENLRIAVSVPFGYRNSEESYPLALTLDGNVMFGLTSEVPRLMAFEDSVPNMIVASVLYDDFQGWITGRSRDFHTPNEGAKTFLKVIETEILPFLDQHYRIDGADKTLYGHSSGGLFALYAGFQRPALFQKILASSPSLEEEPDLAKPFLSLAGEHSKDLPKLFISLGGAEKKAAETLLPFVASLKNIILKENLNFKLYEDLPHMAVIAGAYADGMLWLFRK